MAVTAGQSVSVADINGGLLKFTPAANANGTGYASFTFQVQDNGGTANGGIDLDPTPNTITVNVTAVNDAPVIDLSNLAGVQTSATTASFTENGGAVTVVPQLTLSDVDSPTLAGATVTLTDAQAGDVLSVQGQSVSSGTLASGIGFSITGTTVTFSNVSSLANYQAALQLVQFNNTVVNPNTTDRAFSIQVDDGGGANNLAGATATVTVGSVNHAPQVTVPGTSVTVNEDGSLNLTGATATDADSADTLTATISVGHGALTSLALPSDLAQLTSATGNGTGLLTITGSVSAVNAVVTAGVTYAPAANYNGPDQLTLAVSDNHGGSDSKQVDITVTSVNDAPSGADKTVTTTEDTAYTFTAADFGFSDPNDTPANALLAVKITALPGAGTLTDNNVALSAGQSVSVADINGGLLKFTPAANANGTGYASFTFQVQDNGGTANGGIDLDPTPNTITVTVTAVNDAPSGADKTVTTTEDTAYTFTAADFGFSDPNDSPANTFLAVKITALPGAGTLTDNNVAVTAGQSVSVADINGGLLKFTPAANANGTGYASFTFQVQDNGGTANGGIDLDPTPNTITVNVTAVNDAPVIDLSTLAGVQTSATTASFTENGGAVTVVPQLTLSDVDSPTLAGATVTLTDAQAGDVLSVQGQSVSSGTLASGIGFSITGTTVTFSNVSSLANYQAALQLVQFNNTVVNPNTTDRAFSIQVDDGGGANNLAGATATVTVGSVNHAPQVTVPGTSVTVNEDGSLNLTGATATDADSADTLTATISVGHGALTSLALPSDLAQLTSATGNGTGLLTITGSVSAVNAVVTAGVTYAPAANYNGPDQLTLAVSDNHGGSDSKQVDITVTSVNDAPSGADKTVTTTEDTAYTFTAADFGFSDPNDTPANALLAVKITTLPGAGTLTDNNVAVSGRPVGECCRHQWRAVEVHAGGQCQWHWLCQLHLPGAGQWRHRQWRHRP